MSHRRVPELVEASNFSKNMATAGLSPLETSIVKATYADDTIPKEKHVTAMIKLSDIDTSFLNNLCRRFATHDFRVILKTLIVIHRLSREGNARVLFSLDTKISFFSQLLTFGQNTHHSASSPEPVHARIIRQYTAYLISKIESSTKVGRSIERDAPALTSAWIASATTTTTSPSAPTLGQLLSALPVLQHQMYALLQVNPHLPYASPNMKYVFHLLRRDALRLYSACFIMLSLLLDRAPSLLTDTSHIAILLQCIVNNISLNSHLQEWHALIIKNRFATEQLPVFDQEPAHAHIDQLTQRLDAIDAQQGLAIGTSRALGYSVAISNNVIANSSSTHQQSQSQQQQQQQHVNQRQIAPVQHQQPQQQTFSPEPPPPTHNFDAYFAGAPTTTQAKPLGRQTGATGSNVSRTVMQPVKQQTSEFDFTFDDNDEWSFGTAHTSSQAQTTPVVQQQYSSPQTPAVDPFAAIFNTMSPSPTVSSPQHAQQGPPPTMTYFDHYGSPQPPTAVNSPQLQQTYPGKQQQQQPPPQYNTLQPQANNASSFDAFNDSVTETQANTVRRSTLSARPTSSGYQDDPFSGLVPSQPQPHSVVYVYPVQQPGNAFYPQQGATSPYPGAMPPNSPPYQPSQQQPTQYQYQQPNSNVFDPF